MLKVYDPDFKEAYSLHQDDFDDSDGDGYILQDMAKRQAKTALEIREKEV